jgi:ABC-type uncharacterized transport system permease subunit
MLNYEMKRLKERRQKEYRMELAIGALSFILVASISLIPVVLAFWQMLPTKGV